MTITSLTNPKIKHLVKLYRKAKYRKEYQQFVVEGAKEINYGLAGGYKCVQLFVKEGFSDHWKNDQIEVIEVDQKVYEQITYRSKTEHAVGVFQRLENALPAIIEPSAIYLILDRVEKPGNIGAILRTCDALGIQGVILCESGDLYNPNVIRSSVGCIFHVDTYESNFSAISDWLTKHGVSLYISHLKADFVFSKIDYKRPAALVVGNEAEGIGPNWDLPKSTRVRIPMKGKNDSLNVSVATALLLNQMTQ